MFSVASAVLALKQALQGFSDYFYQGRPAFGVDPQHIMLRLLAWEKLRMRQVLTIPILIL